MNEVELIMRTLSTLAGSTPHLLRPVASTLHEIMRLLGTWPPVDYMPLKPVILDPS